MITPELTSYISQQLGLGKNKDQIRLSLREGGGWQPAEITEAFMAIEHPGMTSTPLRKHSFPWGFILFLLLVVGAGYYAVRVYNIHSYQDAVTKIQPLIDLVHPRTP